MKSIIVKGASENNLKNIDIEIPHNEIVVITGVSGSGKSSLIFDTIFREGQRRYLESFSSYARQFLSKMERPAFTSISGLKPAISIDQKSTIHNSRSTVGTLSELYDYLRLLFARQGKSNNIIDINRNLFSFNSPKGACIVCNGLGVEERISTDLLIKDENLTLRQGALVITTDTGYTVYSQVTIDVLNQVCNANGFDVDIAWKDLTEENKKIIWYGCDNIKIPFGKHTLESRMKWSGITAKPREEGYYKGIIPIMEEILKRDRNANILRFVKSVKCTSCNGTRLNSDALNVKYREKNIADFAEMTIDELFDYFNNLEKAKQTNTIEQPIVAELLQKIKRLSQLGLGYLSLSRESTTLSGGETQRIRLATQINANLRGILYVLDEPSIGLHPVDADRLFVMLKELRDNGNSVLVVEHDENIIKHADRLIDIGKYAGINGGEVVFDGASEGVAQSDALALAKSSKSLTLDFLSGKKTIPIPEKIRQGNNKSIIIKGANLHNLKNIDVEFKLATFNVVTGVSGAGKSTLVIGILSEYLKSKFSGGKINFDGFTNIEGTEHIDKLIEINQNPIGRTPRSNPATYTKLFDYIRTLFASLPSSKEKNFSKSRFSFNVVGGRCETCQGAGQIQIGMHFMGNVEIMCNTCNGKRFNNETLEIKYKDKNIYEVLEMSVDEACIFFSDNSKIYTYLKALQDLGLGYITLGQSSTTLSGGEAQRIKLASELAKTSTGKTLYILDEPTTGLHFYDVKILINSLNKLVDKGNTIIVIEHDLDLIKVADNVIDLGPEGGINGGNIVTYGSPRNIIKQENISINKSATAIALANKFDSSKSFEFVNNKQNKPKTVTENIEFKGITTNNLKNIDVSIPINKITVITGLSGSGKSSLAFDTIFAEGQNRFAENFSTYVRKLIGNKRKGDFDSVKGLTPTIAISQKNVFANPRSTVGTLTEIYDFYRLLFSRIGSKYCPNCNAELINNKCQDCNYVFEEELFASMFSFNHQDGACEHCDGLGFETVCDINKFVDGKKSLLNGALLHSKAGKFYGDIYGQYIATLIAVGKNKDIDFTVNYDELSSDAKNIAMYGAGSQVFDVEWKYKRKNREGIHKMKIEWKGFANYVNEEYIRKHANKNGDSLDEIMHHVKCEKCHGDKLKNKYLNVKIAGLNIAELSKFSVNKSISFFNTFDKQINDKNKSKIANSLIAGILQRLHSLTEVGLDYISIDRTSTTLSGGELQRIKLAGQLGTGLTGVTYILDEPSIGLHQKDVKNLMQFLQKIKSNDNTIIIVEHDMEIIKSADYIIDIGPKSGDEGGEIIAEGNLNKIKESAQSVTAKYLKNSSYVISPKRKLGKGISIKNANKNNLKNINVDIPSGGIISITGVSGSGKSSLVEVLKLQGGMPHCNIIAVNQKAIGTSPLSNPATYTGLFDKIRDLFAETDLAKKHKIPKAHFSFNNKGGRCETCQGMGQIKTSMDFMSDVWTTCEDCKGKRYKTEILNVLYKGESISNVLNMSIAKAETFFNDVPAIHKTLAVLTELGLSYLKLGQASNTLSGGEAQRLKLAKELFFETTGNNLYIFDEPSTGLHPQDVEQLVRVFNKLVDKGNTVLVIEHNQDIIRNSNYIIELGPKGGDFGGEVVFVGGC